MARGRGEALGCRGSRRSGLCACGSLKVGCAMGLQDMAKGGAGVAGGKLGSAAGRAGRELYLDSDGTEESW